MKSSLKNMVLVLLLITFMASAGVGLVHRITQEPIAEAQVKSTLEALEVVLPPFDSVSEQEMTVDNLPITVYTATRGESAVGYAVESITRNGFSGMIRLMVGFTPDGDIFNIRVLEQYETPGLGTKMADEGNPLLEGLRGKNPSRINMGVRKDGGDIDALTAATISSRAYIEAVSRAYNAFGQLMGLEPVSTTTGATAQADGQSGATGQWDGGTGASAQSSGADSASDKATGATAPGEQRSRTGRERKSERGRGKQSVDNRTGATGAAESPNGTTGEPVHYSGATGTVDVNIHTGATIEIDPTAPIVDMEKGASHE